MLPVEDRRSLKLYELPVVKVVAPLQRKAVSGKKERSKRRVVAPPAAASSDKAVAFESVVAQDQ